MIVASGTRRGSALRTPSTSVQITISEASSSAPKIDPEKSLPLRPSVVCSPSRVRATKPVMTSVALGARGMRRSALARDSGQRMLGPSGAWSICDDLARVDPVHLAGPRAARLEVAREEPRRPDLAEAGDEVAHHRRRDANQPDRLQDAGDLAAVGGELLDVVIGRRRGEQRAGDADVPPPDRFQPLGVAVLLPLGGAHEREQRIGDAAARREDRRHARQRIVLEDLRDPFHAGGVRHARPAEFVYSPRFHARSLWHRRGVGLARNGRMADAPVLVAALRDPDESVRATAEQALWIVWSRSGKPQVDKLFAQGLEEMNGGRFDAGIATFTRVIESAPEFAEGWNKRATLYFLTGEYKKSLADCDEVIKRNPAHFGALAGYGQIYLRLDDPEKALEYFRRALVVNPNMDSVEAAVKVLEHSLAQRKKTI